jgi:hypothetical protein
MAHSSEFKRVSLETAAKTLSQFSPPELIFPETNQIANGDFGNLSLEDNEKKRLQEGAIEYRDRLQMIRDQLSHRALLCIAIDQTTRRESGLYVDSSHIRFGEKPESNDPYDLSIVNWEFSPDGHLSRGRTITSSEAPEFGAWDIRYVKDASISNAVKQSNGHYNFETLTIDDASSDNIILSYEATNHSGNRPFYDAFTNAPGENL